MSNTRPLLSEIRAESLRFAGAFIGAPVKLVTDTAQSFFKAVNLGNEAVHLAMDTASLKLRTRDMIARNYLDIEVKSSLVGCAEKEVELMQKMSTFDAKLIEKMAKKKDLFPSLGLALSEGPVSG